MRVLPISRGLEPVFQAPKSVLYDIHLKHGKWTADIARYAGKGVYHGPQADGRFEVQGKCILDPGLLPRAVYELLTAAGYTG